MRVAIVCEHDIIWALPLWRRTIPKLQIAGHEVVGFWNCDQKFADVAPNKVPFWYLKVFGFSNFIKLSIFSFLAILSAVVKGGINFGKMVADNGVDYYECSSPNKTELSDWLVKNEVDILIIMVGHILKSEVLSAPKLATINKHAALLPSHRGLLPYFWAKLNESPQGVSFHEVEVGIDTGSVLVQECIEHIENESMIKFYSHVFNQYPKMLLDALDKCANKQHIDNLEKLNPSSYFGLPTEQDAKAFFRKGGVVIRLSDMPRALEF